MSPIHEEIHTGTFYLRTQYSQRADGQWFQRHETRDAKYGPTWSRWRTIATVALPANLPPIKQHTAARLPKAA